MNIIRPLFERIRPLLEERFPGCFRQPVRKARKMEIQLEFSWAVKR
jgi:hypothetical protein